MEPTRIFRLRACTLSALLLAAALPRAAGAEACVQPPAGLVAWWSLDETTGTVAADRTGAHPGGYAGSPAPAEGRVRNALSFGGTSSVSAPDAGAWAFGAGDFTVELWARLDTQGSGTVGHPGDIFIGSDDGPGTRNKWFFGLGGGYLYFHVNGPGIGARFFPLVPFRPTAGRWYHLAVTKRGTLFTIYVDGAAAGSATNGAVVPDATAPLTIGQAEQIGFVRGRLDEIAIFDRALSAPELQAIVAAGAAGKCIGLAVRPDRGGDTGKVSVRLAGTGFVEGSTVRLTRSGEADIVGSDVTVGAARTTLDTTFDLAGRTRGTWDLVVEPPSGAPLTAPAAFTIEASRATGPWADLVGLGLIRVGRPQQFHVMYGNRGNVDLPVMLLTVRGIPAGARVEAEFEFLVAPPLGGTSPGSGAPAEETADEIYLPLRVFHVPAGFVGALPFRLTVSTAQPFDLRVEASAEVGP